MAGDRIRRAREQWDRLTLYVLLSGYGAWSLFRPNTGSMALAPAWVATPTYVAFMVAGVLLMVGWLANWTGPYLFGNAVGAMALVSVATTVLAVNVAPGSLVVLALGLALLVMLRRTERDNRALRELTDLAGSWRSEVGDMQQAWRDRPGRADG